MLIAGRGDNPQTNGMRASLDNFAPRLGAIYRFNDKTVFRAGYGLTYNATPWARAVRGDNDYPITIASSFFNVEPFALQQHARAGHSDDCPPDQSSGRVPLDRARPNTRRRSTTSIAARCRPGTSRSSAG